MKNAQIAANARVINSPAFKLLGLKSVIIKLTTNPAQPTPNMLKTRASL